MFRFAVTMLLLLEMGSSALAQEISPINKYAWGENVGWINLDDPNVFVALACPADLNNDGLLNFFDVSAFIAAYNAGCP